MLADASQNRQDGRTMIPDAMLDGGDEIWERLSEAIRQCMANLAHGQILEVISHDPAAGPLVSEWCRNSYQELLYVDRQDTYAHFWIRKQQIGEGRGGPMP